MTDLSITLMSGAITMAALTIISLAALRGWGMFIGLRRHEIDQRLTVTGSHDNPVDAHTGSRIELADLRERVRKLEAIAAGVDL